MSLLLIIDLVLNLNNLYVSDGWLYENPTIIESSPLFLIFEDILSKLEQIHISPNPWSSLQTLGFSYIKIHNYNVYFY